jgi:hypothetical protein
MNIRASFRTITAGAVLTISVLGTSTHAIASAAPQGSGTKITAAVTAVTADDGTDGSDPWPRP